MSATEVDGGAIAAALAAVARLTVHDVSPTIDADLPVWFMYDSPIVTPVVRHDQGGAAVNTLSINEHTGTHVDAPFHFDANGTDGCPRSPSTRSCCARSASTT